MYIHGHCLFKTSVHFPNQIPHKTDAQQIIEHIADTINSYQFTHKDTHTYNTNASPDKQCEWVNNIMPLTHFQENCTSQLHKKFRFLTCTLVQVFFSRKSFLHQIECSSILHNFGQELASKSEATNLKLHVHVS